MGKLVLGAGFFLLAFAPVLPVALFGSALAAIGDPMGDIMLLTMIQTDLPSNQIGKVYSLLMILQSSGASIGLLLAVPLFTLVSVPIRIALCASVMVGIGIAGLARFGFSETATALDHKERGKVPIKVANTNDNMPVP